MFEIKYLYLKKGEFFDLVFITIVLSFLFTFSNYLFSNSNENFLNIFIIFIIFIGFLFFSRLILMKLVGYYNAFEIYLHLSYFDRFWVKKWDRLTYWEDTAEKFTHTKTSFSGKIPLPIISILIYILSLGFIIYTSLWNYKIKKIPHLFLGTRQKFEWKMGHMYNIDISDYRYSKALFLGFLYYLLIALILKIFFENSNLYFWFQFIVFWIACFSMIPIFGSEGYEFFRRNNFAWISCFTILILGFLSILIFQNTSYILTATIVSSIILIFYFFWRKLM